MRNHINAIHNNENGKFKTSKMECILGKEWGDVAFARGFDCRRKSFGYEYNALSADGPSGIWGICAICGYRDETNST